MSLIGTIALVVVAAQLLATILFQFAPFKTRLYRLDYIGALPRWRFFVPGAGSLDYIIAARRALEDGTPGAWRTVWEMPPRRPWNWLWSPDPGDDQNMWFAAASLDGRVRDGRVASAETSYSYAMILERCRRGLSSGEVQFAIVRVDADGKRRTSFTSPVHGR